MEILVGLAVSCFIGAVVIAYFYPASKEIEGPFLTRVEARHGCTGDYAVQEFLARISGKNREEVAVEMSGIVSTGEVTEEA